MKERVYGEKVSIDTEIQFPFMIKERRQSKTESKNIRRFYWAIRTRIFPLSGMRMKSNLSFPS